LPRPGTYANSAGKYRRILLHWYRRDASRPCAVTAQKTRAQALVCLRSKQLQKYCGRYYLVVASFELVEPLEVAGVPLVPAEPGTVEAPGVRYVPDVVGDPAELEAPELEPVLDELGIELEDEPDELGVELEDEPDVDPDAPDEEPVPVVASFVLLEPLVAGVPDVPPEPGMVEAPGVR
jgi:hypothetical protein